jgi:hypothetical protein
MPPDLSVDSIDVQRVSDRALSKAAPANESPSSATNPALAGGARCFAQPQSAFPTTTQEWEWCDLTRLFDELIEQKRRSPHPHSRPSAHLRFPY